MKKLKAKKVAEEAIVEEVKTEQKRRGRPSGLKNSSTKRRSVNIEFENFQITGHGGDFVVRKFDCDWAYDRAEKQYTMKKRQVEKVYVVSKTRFFGSLYAACQYILDSLWDEMCELPEETITTFEKLLKFSHKIAKKQDELIAIFGPEPFKFEETNLSLKQWQEKKNKKESQAFFKKPYVVKQ